MPTQVVYCQRKWTPAMLSSGPGCHVHFLGERKWYQALPAGGVHEEPKVCQLGLMHTRSEGVVGFGFVLNTLCCRTRAHTHTHTHTHMHKHIMQLRIIFITVSRWNSYPHWQKAIYRKKSEVRTNSEFTTLSHYTVSSRLYRTPSHYTVSSRLYHTTHLSRLQHQQWVHNSILHLHYKHLCTLPHSVITETGVVWVGKPREVERIYIMHTRRPTRELTMKMVTITSTDTR